MIDESIPRHSHILLVDDDTVFCSVLERALARRGFSVAAAYDAEQALALAERTTPSHAVVDLKLEQSSGLHLIKALLAIDNTIKIVVLTGYGSISTAVEAIKAGAINYLAKPIDVDRLLSGFTVAKAEEDEYSLPKPMSLQRLEWEHIQRVLQEYDGNISAAARSLGMHRRTLQRKLQKRPVKQ